ncbi:MAG TPA: vitamin K epoxide reductase family protein [Acidimicrobiales bacterium]|nr:vitamin K epoxide reductase family protein [Acidimicrobiales bacterium]
MNKLRWQVPWQGPVSFILCLIGIGISVYLTIVHYDAAVQVSCPATGAIDCVAVITSPQSVIFGLPVSLYGLVWFVGMAVLCSGWGWNVSSPSVTEFSESAAGGPSYGQVIGYLRLGGVISGIGFVLYLISVEAFDVHKICLWCTSVHILEFILLVIVISTTGWSLGQLPQVQAD